MSRRKHPTTCRQCREHRTRHRSAVCQECRGLPQVERNGDGLVVLGQYRISPESARRLADMLHDECDGIEGGS